MYDNEGEAVVAPRKPNIFMEVDQIGKDFETIVVDFLGFSNASLGVAEHIWRDSAA